MNPSATANHPAPFVSTPEDAPAYWQADSYWRILAAGDQTFGDYSLIDEFIPAGGGPPPHVHERQNEGFYILDGEVTFQIDTELVTARPGTFLSIPPGTPHAFRVISDTARVLNFYTPGSFDDQISILGTPATQATVPPAGAQHAPTDEQQKRFAERIHDQHTQTWTDVPNLLPELD
jgi:quercetin dioxygenase-like cupin family protein